MAEDGSDSAAVLRAAAGGGSFLSYQRLAKCDKERVKSTTLRVAVARTIGAAENGHPPPAGANEGSGGGGGGEGVSGAMMDGSGGGDGVHFIIVETARGYVLGVVTFAPNHLPASCDFGSAANKPHSYCAGLPTALVGFIRGRLITTTLALDAFLVSRRPRRRR